MKLPGAVSKQTLSTIAFALLIMGAAGIAAGRYFAGPAGVEAATGDRVSAVQPASGGDGGPQFVALTEKQTGSLKIAPVESRNFEVLKRAVGTIDFNEHLLVQVFSQYPGKILKAFFNLGDEVKQGDVLFTIDSPDLLQAESNLLATAGVLELQKRTLARLTMLLKSGGSSQKDVDQSTSDQQTAEGNFKAARNAVRIFGKTDEEVDRILGQRKVDSTLLVPSPISGKIVARNAAPGFLTQPGSAPAPFTVADVSTMWMIANVIETDAPAYRLGQEVEVRVPAYPDKIFHGHVTTVGSMIDPNTRRQLVRSEIADPQHLLRSGMFASFVIRIGDPARSPAVPVEAVVRDGDGTMTVWVTADRHRFVKRTVKVGIQQQGGFSQILEGLEPGELVVTDGAVFLSNKLLLGADG
ncbi:membrane fusion protein, cobalt-zinc-cadmium efflux system [Bradyrhizobium lablabi]|uniref:Membrane fusion protein, cobalt-zinc-cadmium efflux system n=1 Tax=Bradyrhizobium lablabi TaxID=722472 RepID=A0A1M6KIE6_9BRAD|nr:efflux RND transporter periplasmic adaptor subunit [Bradyrhizobium lablabi]SHJ58660.1 membrane fusion protein, cobalt-zinc-cadmium efflux system [Bradyrhizobium lablabi]